MEIKNYDKIEALKNSHVVEIVNKFIEICKPSKATVLTGTKEDLAYIRKRALELGEERKLTMEGHTLHFDGYFDQGRDVKNTRILLPKGKSLSKAINTIDREGGLKEIFTLLDGAMKGKEMLIMFFCLAPKGSIFSIPALQLTDSFYVAHSENILYRSGYEEFLKLKGSRDFFNFVHSAGELDNRMNAKNVDKRRIYVDLEDESVYTINNQYAGNSIGLKKPALRLAISKANREDWLCEHMFIMGAKAHNKDRTTYFTGAFPSACGKTSTAMIPGQVIVGDDIAYIRAGKDGRAYAANVEQGIFGIIQDINAKDDPIIYKAITTPRELIFSNVLVKDNVPYWLGMGRELPTEGENFSGEWKLGKKGPDGKDVLAAHKNARYNLNLRELQNADPLLDDPHGVPIDGMIYGGRDSDTNPPVIEALDYSHGVFLGGALESETTAAKIGAEGVRVHDPMANMDFLVVPLGVYIDNYLKFGTKLTHPPKIFTTNYFLKKDGRYLNEKVDKKVWLMWMEGRVHNDHDAIETPVGFIPMYEDLRKLFAEIFGRTYTKEDYDDQFSLRIVKLLERLNRIEAIYRQETGIPAEFLAHLGKQRERLMELKARTGKDVIRPDEVLKR